MKTKSFRHWLVVSLSMLASLGVQPWKTRAAAIDPDIQNLLNLVAEAYRNVNSFSATMTDVESGAGVALTTSTEITIEKPGKASVQISSGTHRVHIVADGAAIYSDVSANPARYIKEPGTRLEQVMAVMARNAGIGVGLLPILLTQPNAEKMIVPPSATTVRRLPEEPFDGTACEVIECVLTSESAAKPIKYKFQFGKVDHLLRALTVEREGDASKVTLVESFSKLVLNVAAPEMVFVYKPKAGSIAQEPPPAAQVYDPRLKPGAEPLPIAGQDLQGKDVTLDQYKGKVLLIDFWATWCGPCVAELPNVRAAYAKYHDQGFEILGVSLDQLDARAKLEKFIADQNMPWREIYDGKYWRADNADTYGVRAIPFTVLVGRDGKITALSARGTLLAPAIEAALKKGTP